SSVTSSQIHVKKTVSYSPCLSDINRTSTRLLHCVSTSMKQNILNDHQNMFKAQCRSIVSENVALSP
ncbi:hypothetical protein BgiBS90_035919, partial [Biomphalaria glabrata]